MNELPAPVPPNEHAGPGTLLIHLPVLVLPVGGGATGHHGGIAVDTDFDLVRHQRLEIHAPGLAVPQILRPILDGAARAMMSVVLVQDALEEGDIRLDDGLIEVPDELRQLALVSGRIVEWLGHTRLLCVEVYAPGSHLPTEWAPCSSLIRLSFRAPHER